MTKKLKRPLALLFSAAVFLALLMFGPAAGTRSTGFGITASAESYYCENCGDTKEVYYVSENGENETHDVWCSTCGNYLGTEPCSLYYCSAGGGYHTLLCSLCDNSETSPCSFDGNGKCGYCGYECPHTNYTDGVCDVCEYKCPHTGGFASGSCGVCGIPCPHENYTNGFCDGCGGYQPATDSDSDGVYEIGNAGQLYWFAEQVNNDNENFGSANAVLTDNIVVNTRVLKSDGTLADDTTGFRSWTPIGNNSNQYTGTFDGNGKTVSGLYFNNTATSYVGLFGYVGNGGQVSNVGVVDSYFNGNSNVGGVCGLNNYGTIKNCYNTGAVSGNSNNVGGVCGKNQGTIGTIQYCYNTGAVSGLSYVGGVCGYSSSNNFQDCYNTGAVSGTGNYVGGVCGYLTFSGTITNCYNLGAVSGGTNVGGVCGWIDQDTCEIANCYYNSDAFTGNAVNMRYSSTVIENVLGKSAAQFNSGEVAYLLNGSTSEGTLAWGQTLTGEIPDKYPVLDGARVYKTNPCLSYTNDINSINKNHDDFDNGFCKKCGYYQPATVVSADNHQELGESYYDYYAIENAGQLYWFAGLVNGTLTDGTEKNTAANAILTADITVNKNVLESGNLSSNTSGFRSWTPIGDDTNYYNGTFDGNGKTVSGLYFNDRTDYVGLFGYKSDGIVRNVGVIDSYFNGRRYVGGVSGYNINCTITNCYFTGAVNGSSYVGGVCGEIVYSDIANCYNLGAVSGSSYVGGMCGKNGDVNCTINNCYYLEGCNADDTTFDCLVGTSKTAAQFASGEVAYLLQGEQTTAVWGQKLTGDDKQDYPVLGGEHVYQCTECTAKYSNTQGEKGEHTAPDTYDNGFGTCTACGEEVYQPATLNGSTYEISNAGQLYWFAEQVNSDNENFGSANAVLTANITVNTGVLDASGNLVSNTSGFRSWTPIGSDESKAYVGTFDGNGKTVSGLYFNNTDAGYVGLFGYSTGTIKNVGVVDSYFNGANYVGGVFGKIESVTIENCYSKSSVNGAENIGGVCGYVGYFSGIKNCYNTGAVSGSKYVGGVCGEISSYGFIANCYNTGTVSKTGTVSDSDFVGGVCGDNSADEEKAIKNCYYLSGTAAQGVGWGSGSAESKTEDEFNSGEVAYLLSQGCTIGSTTYSGEVWGQTLTGDDKQDYPVLGGAKVYLTTPCPTGYSNTENETKAHKDADEDGICDECGAKFAYIVSLLTEADGTPSVANPSGGGKFSTGDKTTITAEAVPGYTFNGWYKEDGTLVTANLSFEFTVEAEDVTFTAKYQANAEMLITINGGDSYSVAVNNLDPSNFSGQKKTNYAVGTKLTLTANGADFAYWENEAGSVLSRSAEYTFTVVNSATVTAVYNTKADGKATVIFISGYDQIIARDQYASGVDVPVPSAPTKTGCDFAGWSINGGEAVTENVADAVKTAITNALATETTADDIINVKATYNAKTETITVTVVNGTGTGTYTINAVVTVKANEPESGFKFSHWTDGTNTLSYNTSYSFYAAKDITVEAVYVADTEKVAAVGTTEMAEVIRDTSTGTITFVTMSNVPEGCTILKAGLVITSNANVGNSGDSFNDTTAKAYGNSWSGSAYRFSFSLKSAKTFYARAYLVYTDKNGNTNTVYGDMISASVND